MHPGRLVCQMVETHDRQTKVGGREFNLVRRVLGKQAVGPWLWSLQRDSWSVVDDFGQREVAAAIFFVKRFSIFGSLLSMRVEDVLHQ